MCSIAIASMALAGIGTGLQAYGMYQQGQAQAAQMEYKAAVQRNNQVISERQAEDAIQRGRIEEQQQRLQTAQLAGRQKAVMSANGLELSSGTPANILGDTAMMGELDALTIRNNASREAYAYRVQGSNAEAEAGLLQSQAGSARTGAVLGAASTLLNGASSVASKWYRFQG